MPVNGMALASTAVGGVFLYAGIKGYSIPQAFQYVLQGKSPTTLSKATGIDTNTVADTQSSNSNASANASSISADAVQYAGHCYLYGGAPGTNGKNCWDCSSFCNWVIGRDLGLAIPGYRAGQYTGVVHGPATLEWMVWSGCVTVQAKDAQPGDLLITSGHMGIYVGNGKMISALNEKLGTLVTTVQGAFGSSKPTYRRLR